MIGKRRPVRIGLSARIFHPEQDARGIRSKTLQVLEQSVAQWVMARGVLLLMVPSVVQDGVLMRSNIRLRDYAENLDGLILQGGADVSPRAYGEEPLRPEWSGDPVRDAYELELLHEFMEARKPVLGICRGMQLINVALGGSLFQDLPTQCPGAVAHESEAYDRNAHAVAFAEKGQLARWFGDATGGQVVSYPPPGRQPTRPRPGRRGARRGTMSSRRSAGRGAASSRRAMASRIPPPGRHRPARLRADPRGLPPAGAP